MKHLTYKEAGVLPIGGELTKTFFESFAATLPLRKDKRGESILDIGYFANVIKLTDHLGLALSTDGVGTKVRLAQALNRYDTIGIDCVAMNVNDLICVGAEPIAMLDYIAIDTVSKEILDSIAEGLVRGATMANIGIVGGEISQMGDVVKGIDLIGMAVGTVGYNEINIGQDVVPGDVIIGIASNGLHSNGYTLANHALFNTGKYELNTYFNELGQTIGEELLRPTHIYVNEILQILNEKIPINALVNITGDGFRNLTRVKQPVNFVIGWLPSIPPIFQIIKEAGNIADVEMFRTFNMGIGFCIVVQNDPTIISEIHSIIHQQGHDSYTIGYVDSSPHKGVVIGLHGANAMRV